MTWRTWWKAVSATAVATEFTAPAAERILVRAVTDGP